MTADGRGHATVALDLALRETQRAFDGVAAGYDRSNAENVTLCDMRQRARQALESAVAPGSHVLDLGCGPGTDDEPLAARGYRVTAIDWSRAMVDEARRRVARAGVEHRVDVLHLGIHQLDALAPATFDAAYSNFGPLNCVPDLDAAARLIAARLRPGGVLVASVIGRVCPWEIALYGARGQWRRATIRFARDFVPVPLEGRTVWTRYYAPRAFERSFAAAGFDRVSLRALGLFVPPPYARAFAERHRTLVSGLQWIEDAVGALPGLRAWGDHFLIVLKKAAADD
ncbi:MAG: methyltransferase domain-containing protein [Acidobacteriia bacterium]|nr:methyltransferase domain-containing protein [Terriglobia bacterium]